MCTNKTQGLQKREVVKSPHLSGRLKSLGCFPCGTVYLCSHWESPPKQAKPEYCTSGFKERGCPGWGGLCVPRICDSICLLPQLLCPLNEIPQHLIHACSRLSCLFMGSLSRQHSPILPGLSPPFESQLLHSLLPWEA